MGHTLPGLGLFHGRFEPGLVFDAVEWIVATADGKGYPLLAQNRPGKDVDRHCGVHAGVGAESVETLFDSASMRFSCRTVGLMMGHPMQSFLTKDGCEHHSLLWLFCSRIVKK